MVEGRHSGIIGNPLAVRIRRSPSTISRIISVAAVYAGLLGGGWLLGAWVIRLADIDMAVASAGPELLIFAALVLFVLTSALPFVPGAEIGIMLMICFGKPLVLPVYASMVAALTVAFLVGRFVPPSAVSGGLARLGLMKASALVSGLNGCRGNQPAGPLQKLHRGGLISMIVKNRLLALILLLNVPGNSVAGGGGGIALAAGISGLYSIPAFLVAVLTAIAPVPVIFYLTM